MKRYNVIYKGKDHVVKAESATEAIEKYSNRKYYGKRFIFDWRVDMIDADTCGKEWATGHTIGDDYEIELFAEIL